MKNKASFRPELLMGYWLNNFTVKKDSGVIAVHLPFSFVALYKLTWLIFNLFTLSFLIQIIIETFTGK
jgi:hypothetical protein